MNYLRYYFSIISILFLLNSTSGHIFGQVRVVKEWDVFEVEKKISVVGNPFDLEFFGTFQHQDSSVTCRGFYDGDDTFKIRFMPFLTGEWEFTIEWPGRKDNKETGQFTCIKNPDKKLGFVAVRDTFHFSYSNGTPYFPVGTTSYVWNLQGDSLAQITLNTLKDSPFNKIRMSVFPKDYHWNKNEPESYPFQGNPPDKWDYSAFNPAYFQLLEKRILQLRDLGIQADLILFHPYDYSKRWGFHEMDSSTDIRYLEYIIARLSSFSNIWWSMANEYDLIKSKNDSIWDRYFQLIQAEDPYHHLLSIHNGPRWYDHSKSWITHLSIQHQNLDEVVDFRDRYNKPVIIDECGYEGNIPWVWGNLSPQEMVHRFWLGYSRGCYVSHGETYLDSLDVLFWSKGGKLHGESIQRIKFLKDIIEEGPSDGINPPRKGYWHKRGGSCEEPDYYLYYLGNTQPAYLELELPDEFSYTAEIIDTWEMTREKLNQSFSGKCNIPLPGKEKLALIMRRVKDGIQVRKWHSLELEFEGPESSEDNSDNPFLNYRMDVVFEHGDISYKVPGFYAADGNAAESSATSGKIWKVRFTPGQIGEWTYKVSFRKGMNIAISDDPIEGEGVFFDGTKGKFTVIPSDKTGKDFRSKGRLNYVGERYLQFADSESYFLKGGADSPENFLAYKDFDNTYSQRGPENTMKSYEPHIPDWHRGDPLWKENKGYGIIGALNYLASKGMNSVYFLTMNINGDGRDVWPYVNYTDLERFDCSKLDQWEIVFSHMDSLGLMLHILTQETENEMLLDSGEVGPMRKLYYRELIARFSHHLAITWNLGEENGINNGNKSGQSDTQRKDMASYLKKHDPYQHFVVVHTWSRQEDRDKIYPPLLGFEDLDGPSLQVGDVNNIHAATLKWINLSAEAGKKWVAFLDENGPADFGAAPDAFDQDHDTIRHKVLWGNLMAGGAGVEWYFGYKYPHADLSCEDWHTRNNLWDQTRVALDIFHEQLPFQKMYSHDELVLGNAYCFARPGDIYALYLFEPGKVRLKLENDSHYTISWLNPKTGKRLKNESSDLISGPGWVDIEAPSVKLYDYLAIIKKQ